MADTQFYRPERSEVDGRSLWTGGVATALVAALVAVVGVLVVRGVMAIPVIAPGNTQGAIDYVGGVWLAGFAIVGGLLATGIAHVLLLYAPRPLAFLGWIIGLLTLAFAIWPFTVDVKTNVRVANAALYLAIGLTIGIQLTGTASQAMWRRIRG